MNPRALNKRSAAAVAMATPHCFRGVLIGEKGFGMGAYSELTRWRTVVVLCCVALFLFLFCMSSLYFGVEISFLIRTCE